MCGIFGGITSLSNAAFLRNATITMLGSRDRGRDSLGYAFHTGTCTGEHRFTSPQEFQNMDLPMFQPTVFLGNARGEPTTEWVAGKQEADVQPFTSPSGLWKFSHNGTIANDKEIIASWGGTPPTKIDSYAIGILLDRYGFRRTLQKLKGSFALLAMETWSRVPRLLWATNYKPLYAFRNPDGSVFVASQASTLKNLAGESQSLNAPVELGPYQTGTIEVNGQLTTFRPLQASKEHSRRVLVVCSGGLDSGVVAWSYHKNPEVHQVDLLHFDYSAKAGGPERQAVQALADKMGSKLIVLQTDFFREQAPSVLTDTSQQVNKTRNGEAGAEFAHEWVPARNTVMLAMALAYAEAHNYDTIALGSNMEEGGAYPDNEQEFVNKLNALVPYAVKPYAQIHFEDPCGTLVKHEIVKLGQRLGAPFELTWSCYEGVLREIENADGSTSEQWVHCGSCGPCAMRHVAFQMEGLEDPTIYVAGAFED